MILSARCPTGTRSSSGATPAVATTASARPEDAVNVSRRSSVHTATASVRRVESCDDVDFTTEGRAYVANPPKSAATGQRVTTATRSALTSGRTSLPPYRYRGNTLPFPPIPSAPHGRPVVITRSPVSTAGRRLSATTTPHSPTPTPIEQATTIMVTATPPHPPALTSARTRGPRDPRGSRSEKAPP